MLYIDHRQEPSLWPLLMIVAVIVGVSVYAIVSVLAGDALWFSRDFEATPSAILVHCYGESLEIPPGSADFPGLTGAVNRALSGRKRWDSLSLSQGTYEDYQTRTDTVVVELFYPEPLRIHTNTRLFSNVSNLIIPVEGRHSETNAVFGRHQGNPAGGSLHVQTTDPIRTYLADRDICPLQ